jgi:autotransporter-associated beta strand protein
MKFLSRTLLALSVLSTCGSLSAQTTWDGGGGDNFWSTSLNWTTDAVPGTTSDVVFGDLDKTTSSTPNSVLSASGTIRSLTFNNTGSTASDWQNVEIASGQVLSINSATTGNALLVGGVNNTATLAKITGEGRLVINGGTTADFVVRGPTGGTITSYATPSLDMSGLASFEATLDLFALGSNGVGLATVTLAQDNTVTANSLTIGTNTKNTSSGAGGNSVLNLGAANILNVDSITVGNTNSRTGGTLQFAAPGGSVTIRGRTGGTSRADMIVAQGGDGSGATTSIANFSGGLIDARFDELVVGSSSVGNTNPITGEFSMSAGTVDASTVVVGRRTGSGSGSGVGNLNVSGGSFQAGAMTLGAQAGTATNTATGTLSVSGSAAVQVGTSATNANLVMGDVTGTVNLTSNATVDITGGNLTVFGNIAEGANAGTGTINSALTLNGGTLDLTGHDISVDTFNAESGTLANLAEFNGGANLVKTTGGALTLQGGNTYSGSTVVNAGTLLLADNASMTFYIEESGVNNGISGVGAVSLDGDFVFDLTLAVSEGSWAIVSVDTLSEAYGSTFSVQGFTETSSGVWQFGGYTFTEATGVLTAVPEPSAVLLTGLGLTLVLWRGARRVRA